MSNRMLVQRQKAATSTNTHPAIPCPTFPTLAPSADQQPSVKPPQAATNVPASVQEVQDATRASIAQSRQEWQAELDSTEKQYHRKAGKATQDQKKKIAVENKGEQTSAKHIDEAEKKAEQEKQKARTVFPANRFLSQWSISSNRTTCHLTR